MEVKKPFVVLVVEDEALLRLNTASIVEEAGFIALEAETADKAVEILEARSDVDLLLTDVQMPGSMNGLALAHSVRGRWPPIKIIIVSGHLEIETAELPPKSKFFKKPFDTEALIEELRALAAA